MQLEFGDSVAYPGYAYAVGECVGYVYAVGEDVCHHAIGEDVGL